MSYQALYNKYRPQTFDEVVGQKAVTLTLRNALKEDKISHAYLFCGPRGTGKTTMARLFAKALNCKEGIGNQCNECDSCRAIMRGDHPDVIEIDAASNSSVESARQLVETVDYQPIMSRYKIYIIDEVHSMSTAAFNALLKTLEEPPSFVVFILATTEPQKVLPTILSRVQRFDFSKVSRTDLIKNMKRILKSENIEYEEEALELIASLSDGGVRDSLSLLDQAVSYCGDELTAEDVDSLFGLLSVEEELKIVSLCESGDASECISLVKSKYEHGMDIIRLHSDLISIYKDILIYQATENPGLLERLSPEQASSHHEDEYVISQKIDLLIGSKREYRTSDNFLSHFELTLLRLMEIGKESTDLKTERAETPAVKSETPKTDETSDEKPSVYDSKPDLIKSTKRQNGFVTTKSEVEEAKEDEKIGYDIDELVNLMVQADKDERIKVTQSWDKLSQYLQTHGGYEVQALIGFKLNVCARDILLVTSPHIGEVSKINTKKAQPILTDICKNVFGKEYHVLPITQTEFREAYAKYKVEKDFFVARAPKIDFGSKSSVTNSTAFLSELLND